MASFQIQQDQENQVSNIRLRTRKNVNFPQKRSALGTINLQSNANILQTKKATLKQAVKKDVTKAAAFNIHDDNQENIETVFPKPILENKLTNVDKLNNKENAVPVRRQPLRELPCLSNKVEKEDEAMSEGSIVYEDELSMAVDKSTEIKRVQIESLYVYYMDDYREEIFKYLLKSENRNRPKSNYMRRQQDITYSMRTILVNWLVEVGEEYKMHSETLHIAVNLIDRFLSLMSVVPNKLQLLGTAAMFVASKYEEIYPPDVLEFAYITNDTYTKKQVLRMEHLILKVLMFDVSIPTPLMFIQLICVSCAQNNQILNMALYLCELTLLEGDPYLQFLPSKIACSAIALARHCVDEKNPWPSDLETFTSYTLDDLMPCVVHLNTTHSRAPSLNHKAVQDKYKTAKWQCVSEVTPKPLLLVPE